MGCEKGRAREFDAVQGPKPYSKAYLEKVKQFLENVSDEMSDADLPG